jgi:hypothetical protein
LVYTQPIFLKFSNTLELEIFIVKKVSQNQVLIKQPVLRMSLVRKMGKRLAFIAVPTSTSLTKEFSPNHYLILHFYTLYPCYEEREGLGLKKAAHLSQANSF